MSGRFRLAFMGTPDFAVPALDALAGASHTIAAVYTQPPRPGGRGQRLRESPVHRRARALGLPVRTPATLKAPDTRRDFRDLGLDVAVVAAYGLILPKPVLEAPRHGCLNLHASLLPRWRGAAPIQRAILAGDLQSGVTVMHMDEGLDTGAIVRKAVASIEGLNAGQVHDALAALAARLIVETLESLASGALRPEPQDDAAATYARKIDPAEARILWREDAGAVLRRVRAFAPRPGAFFVLPETEGVSGPGDPALRRVRVLDAVVAPDPASAAGTERPGTVLDRHLTVACGRGAVRLLVVQRAGKAAMDAAAYLRGHPVAPGTVLDGGDVGDGPGGADGAS